MNKVSRWLNSPTKHNWQVYLLAILFIAILIGVGWVIMDLGFWAFMCYLIILLSIAIYTTKK